VVDSAWVALSLVPYVGGKTFDALMRVFGSVPAVLGASQSELLQVEGVGKRIAEGICAINLTDTEKNIAQWQAQGIHILTRHDACYPHTLRDLDDAPPTLFIRGECDTALWDNTVAIVGTRNPSPKARVLARKIAENYARSRYTVVSGLAMGIDRLAHEGAISVGQGRTVAVLGCGVLNPYPLPNVRLSQNIMARGGCLISEYAPTETVHSTRLVARNRLISGLSRLLILVESESDGGAMHAVKFARQQGRTLHVANFEASGNQEAIQQGVAMILG
jgi:DNA processing protein